MPFLPSLFFLLPFLPSSSSLFLCGAAVKWRWLSCITPQMCKRNFQFNNLAVCCLDFLCRSLVLLRIPCIIHSQVSDYECFVFPPLTQQGNLLKYNVEFIFNSTLYIHAHTFVLNPTCLMPASLLWTKTSLSQHPINRLNECITHVVSQLHSSYCHGIQHKTRSDCGGNYLPSKCTFKG